MLRRLAVAFAAVLCLRSASAAPADKPPTPEEAKAFIERAESSLLSLWIDAERASWVYETFITDDTEKIQAEARQKVIDETVRLSKEAQRFKGLTLPDDVARKFRLLPISLSLVAPSDPAKSRELSEIAAQMEGIYGKAKYCPPGKECLDIGGISERLASSRDPKELTEIWEGWHAIAKPIRPKYERFVTLANEGAREIGFDDLGALWRSGYDMPPAAFAKEMDRLWSQVKPLYDALHCYVRRRLAETYGPALVPPGKPIPAQLLGNLWAQSWGNVYPLVAPPGGDRGYDLTKLLADKNVDAKGLVRYGEGFFKSLGFPSLPGTFWERSQFVKPRDRDVVCHASAWDIDWKDDLRLKMCIQLNDEDFVTVHHELGHNFYQRAYNAQPPLFAQGANDGFHEGIGDAIALSATPAYLVKIGLLDKVPAGSSDLPYLMKMALDKVAFLPFGLVVDQWRWKVFSGEITPASYNKAWWDLKLKYQGVVPPSPRTENDFDPGAKYHVPANTPYARYFLAAILQFQFHRALCKEAGITGPLDQCSIYGNKKAGEKFASMLSMGTSKPWPDELAALSGERSMDASALLEYFAPLKAWLDEQNKGQVCGW
ncbi:MAG TPA: M2 family metallopeptidase [Candidatus Polarisedimenticolaceae bacterium]|nr:M2 family metallopeptidase [Candidatus Polarisedimenticolaceae bacterium]